jgi:hypothetical protein
VRLAVLAVAVQEVELVALQLQVKVTQAELVTQAHRFLVAAVVVVLLLLELTEIQQQVVLVEQELILIHLGYQPLA